MSYATRAQIAAMVPADVLARAVDSDGNLIEESTRFAAILAVIEEEVDALLAPVHSVPFTGTIPAAVADATRKLLCERLYMLNSTTPADNPWTEPAAEVRKRLALIGAGKLPLATDVAPALADTDDDDLDWAIDNQEGL